MSPYIRFEGTSTGRILFLWAYGDVTHLLNKVCEILGKLFFSELNKKPLFVSKTVF